MVSFFLNVEAFLFLSVTLLDDSIVCSFVDGYINMYNMENYEVVSRFKHTDSQVFPSIESSSLLFHLRFVV